jgi:ABC-type nitrate/sulfonate/bicarbonate transport system substrate-binding protein
VPATLTIVGRIPAGLVLSVFFLGVFNSTDAATQALQRVRISYSSTGINFMDLFLGKDKGYFRDEGLELQFIQVAANIAINAGISGELDGLASIGSAIRAIQRGAPLRVLAVNLRRPLYWLVARPEYRSIKDLKGKILGINTIGGSQHLRAKGMLTLGGLDVEKDITSIQVSDQTRQIQALLSNSIQVAALSPPWNIVARDKFKLRLLDSAMEKFAGIESGLAMPVQLMQEKRDLAKRILRARAKGSRQFMENERDSAELLARLYNIDLSTALESYRRSKAAFTQTGIPTDEEIREHLAADAHILKLPKPVPANEIFDFTLQREVHRELGIKG